MLFGGLGRPFGHQKELKKPSFLKSEKHGFPPRIPCFARLGPPQNREKNAPKSERKTMKINMEKNTQKHAKITDFGSQKVLRQVSLFHLFGCCSFFRFGSPLGPILKAILEPTWPNLASAIQFGRQLGPNLASEIGPTASGFLAQSGKLLIPKFQNNLFRNRTNRQRPKTFVTSYCYIVLYSAIYSWFMTYSITNELTCSFQASAHLHL